MTVRLALTSKNIEIVKISFGNVITGNTEFVRVLLEFCPEMATCRDNSRVTPIHSACLMGRIDTANLLLQPKYGVDVDVQDITGWTPFMYAIHAEQEECALLVFKKSNRSDLDQICSLEVAIADPERMEAVLQALATMPDFFSLLNHSIRYNLHLLRGKLQFLLDFPYLLDIDNRLAAGHLFLESSLDYEYAEAALSITDPGPPLVAHLSREEPWQSFLHMLDVLSAEVHVGSDDNDHCSVLQHNVLFQFDDEPGIGIGVERELFEVLSGDMVMTVSPTTALLPSCQQYCPLFTEVQGSSTHTCVPIVMNPTFKHRREPAFFEFGQLVGHLLLRKIRSACNSQGGCSTAVLSLNISECFWKIVCNEAITLHDVASVDSELYKNLQWLLSNEGASNLDLSFTASTGSSRSVSELVRGGANISVDDSNKEEYVQLLVDHSIVNPMSALAEQACAGIKSIIPEGCFELFGGADVSLLVTGVVEVDVQDWQAHTVYSGYDASSDVIRWFWEFVSSLDTLHRSKLLRCVPNLLIT